MEKHVKNWKSFNESIQNDISTNDEVKDMIISNYENIKGGRNIAPICIVSSAGRGKIALIKEALNEINVTPVIWDMSKMDKTDLVLPSTDGERTMNYRKHVKDGDVIIFDNFDRCDLQTQSSAIKYTEDYKKSMFIFTVYDDSNISDILKSRFILIYM
jgi:hypothetical protein